MHSLTDATRGSKFASSGRKRGIAYAVHLGQWASANDVPLETLDDEGLAAFGALERSGPATATPGDAAQPVTERGRLGPSGPFK